MIQRWLRRMLIFLAATAWATPPAVANRSNETILLDGVAATVNRHMITIGDVRELMAPVAIQLQQHYIGRELDQRLSEAYDQALRNLIDRALILDAYHAGDTPIPERLLAARVREITFDQFGNDREAFWRRLDDAGLTLEVWQQQVRESIVISLLHDAEVDHRVVVPPGSIRDAYTTALDRYRIPAQVRLGVILIRDTGDDASRRELLELAESLVTRLRAGAPFDRLAREYSQGRQADDGGDWGWIDLSELRPELAGPAQQLAIDEVSDVITINAQHYIVHVKGRRHEQVVPLAEVYDEIYRELRRQAVDRLYDRWIARLEANSAVRPLEHGLQ